MIREGRAVDTGAPVSIVSKFCVALGNQVMAEVNAEVVTTLLRERQTFSRIDLNGDEFVIQVVSDSLQTLP